MAGLEQRCQLQRLTIDMRSMPVPIAATGLSNTDLPAPNLGDI